MWQLLYVIPPSGTSIDALAPTLVATAHHSGNATHMLLHMRHVLV